MYPKVNLEMGPTFVHKNMRYDEMNEAEKFDQYHDGKGRGYASYNKPYSVMAWLEQTHVEEEMVLVMATRTRTVTRTRALALALALNPILALTRS